MYEMLDAKVTNPPTGYCPLSSVHDVALPIILSLLSDVGILTLPVTTVLRLHMKLPRKLGMLALFSLGALYVESRLKIIFMSTDKSEHVYASWYASQRWRLIRNSTRTQPVRFLLFNGPNQGLANSRKDGIVAFDVLTPAVLTIAISCACLPVVAPKIWKGFQELSSSIRSSLARSRRRQERVDSESHDNLQTEGYELGTVAHGGGASNHEDIDQILEQGMQDGIQVRTDVDVEQQRRFRGR